MGKLQEGNLSPVTTLIRLRWGLSMRDAVDFPFIVTGYCSDLELTAKHCVCTMSSSCTVQALVQHHAIKCMVSQICDDMPDQACLEATHWTRTSISQCLVSSRNSGNIVWKSIHVYTEASHHTWSLMTIPESMSEILQLHTMIFVLSWYR